MQATAFRLKECQEIPQQKPAFKTFSINNLQKFSSASSSSHAPAVFRPQEEGGSKWLQWFKFKVGITMRVVQKEKSLQTEASD